MADDHLPFDKAAVICGRDETNGESRMVLLTHEGAVLVAFDDTAILQVQGTVAHDSPDANNPVKIGGHANAGDRTAVSENDRVDAAFDLNGKQKVVVYTPPASAGSGSLTHTANFGAGTVTGIGGGNVALLLHGFESSNGNLHDLYLKFWDAAAAPAQNTTPKARYLVPRGSVNSDVAGRDRGAIDRTFLRPLQFTLGCWYQLSTLPTDSNTAVWEDTSDSATLNAEYTV